MKTIDLIDKELRKEYPSGIVSDLKRTNNELYLKLKDYAKQNGTSIKELVEQKDYVYLRKSIIRLYVDDFLELEKRFPDYKIRAFYEVDNKLYYKILSHAKSLKVDMKKYLNSLGFDYESRNELSDDMIKKDLLALYPNKKVTNLSTTDNKLYYRIYQYAKKNNLTIGDLLNSLGFELSDNEIKTNKNNRRIKEDKTLEKVTPVKTVKKNNPKKNTKETDNKKTSTKKKPTTTNKSKESANKKESPATNKETKTNNPKTIKKATTQKTTSKRTSIKKATTKNTNNQSNNKENKQNKENESNS